MKKAAKKAATKVATKKVAATKAEPIAVPATKVAAKKVVAKKAAVKKVAAKKAAPKSAPAPKAATTTINAAVDVGFGNTLFLRGEGAGLSWEKGIPMDCNGDNIWSISVSDAKESITFKLLINDSHWCAGENQVAKPGETVSVSPCF